MDGSFKSPNLANFLLFLFLFNFIDKHKNYDMILPAAMNKIYFLVFKLWGPKFKVFF